MSYAVARWVSVGLVALLLGGCGSSTPSPDQSTSIPAGVVGPGSSSAPAASVPLVLSASGSSGPFDVSWFTGSGKSQVANGVKVKWQQVIYSTNPQAVSLGVQSESSAGTVSCQIARDGRVVAHASGSGTNGASCSYPAAS